MLKPKWYLIYLPFLLFSFCSRNKEVVSSKSDKKLLIATTGFAAEICSRLCDTNKIAVMALMGPGADPHTYKPTLRDAELLYSADIIVAHGLHLEGKMQDLFENLEESKRIIFLANAFNKEDLIFVDKDQLIPDPHFWFDATLFAKATAFCALQLAKENVLRANLQLHLKTYLLELLQLDAENEIRFAEIPTKKRILVTTHDAFQYLGRRYRIKVESLQGVSTVADFSVKNVSDLVNFLVENKINTIFAELSTSNKALNAIQNGCAAKGWRVKIGQPLYTDALGGDNSGQKHYNEMYNYNCNLIYNSMGGDNE